MSGMHALEEIEMYHMGFPQITHEERRKIRNFKIPCERGARHDPRFYPRRPVIDVNKWLADHAEKLRGLEAAAGVPRAGQ